MKNRERKPRPRVELEIESIAFPGNGVAKIDGFVYFVKGAITGDKVIAEVTKKKSSYAEAKAVEILEPSDKRVMPECRYFGVCGGCTWQQTDYDFQIENKRLHVASALERIGKISGAEVQPALGSPAKFNYRNKMEFSFGSSRWLTEDEISDDSTPENKNFALGLHIPGRYDKVLEIDDCRIQSEIGNEILRKVKTSAISAKMTAYNSHTRSGFLRNLIIRRGLHFDETMAVLLTSEPASRAESEFASSLVDELPRLFPSVVSSIHAVNRTCSPVAQGELVKVVGRDYIRERILDVTYKISPFSFFQTNSYQLDQFIGKIIRTADLSSEDTVWDLYCGAGSITLPASKQCKKIVGIEIYEGSIADAKDNAKENGIENADLICADLHAKNAAELINSLPRPDKIIIDPPRAGMHKNLVDTLLEIAAPVAVYVSCNPATQARDCELLAEKYDVKTVIPTDMFPHTFHIESIARLELKKEFA